MAEAERSNILESIRELKAKDPFTPFTIVVSSGDRYLIESPENLVEMRSELFYAYPGGDKFVLIRISEIVAVERSAGGKRRARRRAS